MRFAGHSLGRLLSLKKIRKKFNLLKIILLGDFSVKIDLLENWFGLKPKNRAVFIEKLNFFVEGIFDLTDFPQNEFSTKKSVSQRRKQKIEMSKQFFVEFVFPTCCVLCGEHVKM